MSDSDEEKLAEATGGATVSDEEMKLLEMLRTFSIKPRVETPDDLAMVAKALRGIRDPPMAPPPPPPPPPADPSARFGHHFPKLSNFYGEPGKEGNWDTFKYEVESLIRGRAFTGEQIMFGIRRAVKGSASDKLRWLGPDVTPRHVLDKLECDYGTVENKESALRKLYTCEQRQNESVESYATRLEELFYRCVELRALRAGDKDTLKKKLHSGLRTELKQMTVYQLDKFDEYDEFKMELRKIESELKIDSGDKKPCKPVVGTEKKGGQ